MKKALLTLSTIALLSTVTVSAQEVSLIGGMNMSKLLEKDDDETYSNEDGYKSRIGANAGVLFGFELKENMFIETGIMFNTAGSRFVEKEDDAKYVGKVKLSYLNLPITLKYAHELNDKVRIYGLAGPTIGVAVAGKVTELAKLGSEKAKDKESIDFGNDEETDDAKRLDLGLMFGAGVDINKIRLGVFYNLGVMNISPYSEDGYRMKNRNFGISVGYYLKK